MEDKPIKRDQNIVRLSREHHFGLLFGWKLRQGIKFGVAPKRMQEYVRYFWAHHLQEHFETEEKVLFPNSADTLVARALQEHRAIQKLIQEIGEAIQPSTAQLNAIADLVSDHIRFEERALFPHLESTLTEVQLMNVGRQLDDLHREPAKDEYQDEFWVK